MTSCRDAQGVRIEELAAVEGLSACHIPQRQRQLAHHSNNRLALDATVAFDLLLVPGRDHGVLVAPPQSREVEVFARLPWPALGDLQVYTLSKRLHCRNAGSFASSTTSAFTTYYQTSLAQRTMEKTMTRRVKAAAVTYRPGD